MASLHLCSTLWRSAVVCRARREISGLAAITTLGAFLDICAPGVADAVTKYRPALLQSMPAELTPLVAWYKLVIYLRIADTSKNNNTLEDRLWCKPNKKQILWCGWSVVNCGWSQNCTFAYITQRIVKKPRLRQICLGTELAFRDWKRGY